MATLGWPAQASALPQQALYDRDQAGIVGEKYLGQAATGIVTITTTAGVGTLGSVAYGADGTVLGMVGGAPVFAALTGASLSGFTSTRVPYAHTDGTLTSSAELTYATATGTFDVAKARSGGMVTSTIRNTSDTASSTARQLVEVAGNSSGDPSLRLSIVGQRDWDVLAANATSDEFQIREGGTNIYFRITTGGLVGVTGSPTHLFDVQKSVSGSAIVSAIRNISNTASSAAQLLAEVAGSSAGNPHLRLSVAATQAYDVTVLNATSDELHFRDATGNKTLFAVTSGGSFCIGDRSPGAGGPQFLIDSAGNTGVARIQNSATSTFAQWRTLSGTTDGQIASYGQSSAATVHGEAAAGMVIFHCDVGTKTIIAGPEVGFAVNSVRAGTIRGTKTIASAAGATWDGWEITAATATVSGNTNITTAAGFNYWSIKQPTISAALALTITHAATMYIANAPAAAGAGPATITNAYAIWVDAGLVRLDGNGTHVLEVPADATGNTSAATGRVPVKVGGATKYLRYFDD